MSVVSMGTLVSPVSPQSGDPVLNTRAPDAMRAMQQCVQAEISLKCAGMDASANMQCQRDFAGTRNPAIDKCIAKVQPK
jgi:hypothetical protein